MRWNRKIYAGQYAADYKSSILKGLRAGRVMPSVYVITRALGNDGLLDIYHSSAFRRQAIRDRDPIVIGIAMSRSEAFDVAKRIVEEMYFKNGDFDIDAFCDPDNS